MLIGGLWHGPSWTFVAWGFYHGMLLVFYRGLKIISNKLKIIEYKSTTIIKIIITFILNCIGWVFFRSYTIDQAFSIIYNIGFNISFDTSEKALIVLLLILPIIVIDMIQFKCNDRTEILTMSPIFQVIIYSIAICAMMVYGVRKPSEFIYFAF